MKGCRGQEAPNAQLSQARVAESIGVAGATAPAAAAAAATCGTARDVGARGAGKRRKLHDTPADSVRGPAPRSHALMMNRWREVAHREASRVEREQPALDLQRWEAEQRRCGAAQSNPNFIPLGTRH